jgi:hypothetical protein
MVPIDFGHVLLQNTNSRSDQPHAILKVRCMEVQMSAPNQIPKLLAEYDRGASHPFEVTGILPSKAGLGLITETRRN